MPRTSEHSSYFSYPIQRPYPLRWFTPTAIVGGIIFALLVSLANFVASGYELTTVYASDPSTVSKHFHFKRWPAWLRNNIDPTCEPANLPIGSRFFTNQTALAYTLNSIAVKENGVSTTLPSLPYLNNVLGACEVLNITMDFDCSDTQNPTQIAHGVQGFCTIDVRAYSSCVIDGPNGVTHIDFSSLYNPQQGHPDPGTASFIATNITNRAPLWWARQFITAYWLDATKVVGNTLNLTSSYNKPKQIISGAANFYRGEPQNSIEQLDFFDVWFDFVGTSDGTYYMGTHTAQALIEDSDVEGALSPPIWLQADQLAKSMYSAVLTDLGQTVHPLSSNIVAEVGTLQKFWDDIPSWIKGVPVDFIPDGVVNGTFDEVRANLGAGSLDIPPSVISTQYLCSVPRMKSGGNIFISILLADLVFLNTAWVLYSLIVQHFFVKGPTSNWCEGCVRAAHELQPLGVDGGLRSNRSSMPMIPKLGFDAKPFSTSYEPVQLKNRESSESLAERGGRPGG